MDKAERAPEAEAGMESRISREQRDCRIRRRLQKANWRVVTMGECSLRKRLSFCVARLKRMLQSR